MKRKLAAVALSATATLVSLTIIDVAYPYEAAASGEQVEVGQDIARVGSSGNSTGPHLHLSVWQDESHTDPEAFFAAREAALR